MREGSLIGNQTQFSRANSQHSYDDQPQEAPAHNSADLLDRTAMKVERLVDSLEGLLAQITGPRNHTTPKVESVPPRPVPVLSRMLEQTPAAISVQCDRAGKLMEEIRQALGL